MISVTPNAQQELDMFFKQHPEEMKSVRVYMAPGGCCGPKLTMALDKPNNQDAVEQVEGITYCMSSLLAMQTGEVTIDIGYMGFMLTPEHALQGASSCSSGGCSGCSGSCGG